MLAGGAGCASACAVDPPPQAVNEHITEESANNTLANRIDIISLSNGVNIVIIQKMGSFVNYPC